MKELKAEQKYKH